MDTQAEQDPEAGSSQGRLLSQTGSAPASVAASTFRCPVEIDAIDVSEAVNIARSAIAAAGLVVDDVDTFLFGQLVEQVVKQVHSQQVAEHGLCVKTVAAEARVGTGHLPDHYTPEVEALADLAVRLILLSGGGRVHHEEIFSVAARGRRTQKGFGTCHIEQAPSIIHFAGNAIGASDRNSITWATPLVTGTPWDATSERADALKIADAEQTRGRAVPSTPADHVAEIFEFQRRQRELVLERAVQFADALSRMGIVPKNEDFGRAFARPLVLRGMPVGPPLRRGVRSQRTLHPGSDRDIVALLRRSGRPAVAFAGPATNGHDLASMEARGYIRQRWDVGDLGRPLGVPENAPFGVELLWSETEQTLVRRVAADGAYMRSWKIIGFQETEIPSAIALVERASEEWPHGCILRATKWCAPGKLQVSTMHANNTWRALSRIADAALVEAERRERARRDAG